MRIKNIIILFVLCILAVMVTSCATSEKPVTSSENGVAGEKREPSPLATRYSLLIQQLGSDDWQTRESTTQELIKMGESVMPELEKTYNTTKDPEVKSRIRQITDENGYILDPKLREQVNQWLEQLYSPDGNKRVETFNNLINSNKVGIKALKQILESLPPEMEILLVADKPTIRAGEATSIKFMVKNLSNKPALIMQSFSRVSYISGHNDLLPEPKDGSIIASGGGGGERMISPRDKTISSFLKKAMVLKPAEFLEIPAESPRNVFSASGVGIYSYPTSQSNEKVEPDVFSGVSITFCNIITSINGTAVICVLPKEEDLGKGIKKCEVSKEIKTGGNIDASFTFADDLNLSEYDQKFGLWYILLDEKLNPANYGNLTDQVKLPDKLAGAKIDFAIKIKDGVPAGEYQLLVGYGNAAFSKLEKILILKEEKK